MKKITSFFKKRPVLAGVGTLIIIIIFLYIVFGGRSNSSMDTIVVHPQDFVEKLTVSGTVEPAQNANLGFTQSGRIAGAYANVGDFVKAGTVLAKIENGDLRATLLQKQATLEREQANLATKQQGTRPEELALTTQKYKDASVAYAAALHASYLQIQQALLTKSDSIFMNGNSVNPTLTIPADSWNEERATEAERVLVGQKLDAWKSAMTTLDASSPTFSKDALTKTQAVTADTINTVKDFYNDLARIVGKLIPTGAGAYSQATIDTYRANINTASQQVSTAETSVNTAQFALNNAQNSLALEVAGSTQNDIAAQSAVVKAAQADVASAFAQLNKTIITAPFDGIVTKMDAKVGEIASANTSDISVNSNGIFQIKSNVPEVYISNLQIGNSASTTLDAYGPNVFFPLKVIAIDPAQTVVNGVSNYKTTLQFINVDPRIKIGMTANIIIKTGEVQNALVVPLGALFTKNGQQFVQLRQGNKTTNQMVVAGNASSIGQVQIATGLRDGDSVVLNPVTK